MDKIIAIAVACGVLVAVPMVAAVAATPAPAARAAAPAPDALLKQAQEALQTLKFDTGPADGLTGPRTMAALKAYQKSKGYAQSGILDTATAAALGVKR